MLSFKTPPFFLNFIDETLREFDTTFFFWNNDDGTFAIKVGKGEDEGESRVRKRGGI